MSFFVLAREKNIPSLGKIRIGQSEKPEWRGGIVGALKLFYVLMENNYIIDIIDITDITDIIDIIEITRFIDITSNTDITDITCNTSGEPGPGGDGGGLRTDAPRARGWIY